MVLLYVITGLCYALLNGIIRKIDTDGDPMLPLVWFLLWPICMLAVIVDLSIRFVIWLTTKKSQDS